MSSSLHRRECLKLTHFFHSASADDEEEVAWDEDSDSEPDTPSTPQVTAANNKHDASQLSLSGSGSTLPGKDSENMLKPAERRRSNDQQSQADSDASYDLVSGAASHAPGSPKEGKASSATQPAAKPDDDSDEDWE